MMVGANPDMEDEWVGGKELFNMMFCPQASTPCSILLQCSFPARTRDQSPSHMLHFGIVSLSCSQSSPFFKSQTQKQYDSRL